MWCRTGRGSAGLLSQFRGRASSASGLARQQWETLFFCQLTSPPTRTCPPVCQAFAGQEAAAGEASPTPAATAAAGPSFGSPVRLTADSPAMSVSFGGGSISLGGGAGMDCSTTLAEQAEEEGEEVVCSGSPAGGRGGAVMRGLLGLAEC